MDTAALGSRQERAAAVRVQEPRPGIGWEHRSDIGRLVFFGDLLR